VKGTSRRRRRRRSRLVALLTLTALAIAVVVAWRVDWLRDSAPLSQAYITNDVVNLRSGPATSFQVLDVLDTQTAVQVTGDLRQGFLPVSVDGQEAWIAADYLTPEGATEAATETESGDTVAAVMDASEGVATRSGLIETANAAPAVVDAPSVEPEPDGAPTNVPVEVSAPDPAIDEQTEPATEMDDEPAVPGGERWVEVDRSTALVTLHHGDSIVATYQGKIGRDPSVDGYYSTAVGTFHVFSMNKELTETPFVEGVYLTDWVGFDPERSNGFHSPVRDADGYVVNTQGAVTMGCVRLEAQAAESLFDFAFIGMRVEIHD
jgi:uncharacterized protein YraI